MASIVIWLVGLLFIFIGVWILLLRLEGVVDVFSPHNMSIGQMTIDGKESRGYAELLRARFDHHFRRPMTWSNGTGFVEAAALDTPGLFQQKPMEGTLEKVTLEVSGVDVTKFLQFLNAVVRPGQWVLEGDFQTQPDRALLALRLSRGQRLIRTWYLERPGTAPDKSDSLEKLVDDAIFQLVYDFGNKTEENEDLRKWRGVVPVPDGFPSPAAVGAYYEARGALGRYYAHRDWKDLDLALARLRTLRGEMPKYADGLQLLGMALAERRNETEAIHVYEQLRLLLLSGTQDWTQLPPGEKRRLLSVDLLKATATVRLYTWQSTHNAIAGLLQLDQRLGAVSTAELSDIERASYGELRAQTAVELAYAYALYLSYIRDYQVAEIFGSRDAPADLRVSDPDELKTLNEGPVSDAKDIVRRTIRAVAAEHKEWLARGTQAQSDLRTQWQVFADGNRRRAELVSRLSLTSGYANYRMAEWERAEASAQSELVFGEAFKTRLDRAANELGDADAAHPSHYLVLQLLGLVYSEPRRDDASISVAEQYFERAIQAKPSDYYGHELLAGLLLRKVANAGVDVTGRATLERGLSEAQAAVSQRDSSGAAHLLKAEFQTMLFEIERDEAKRRELRDGLEHSIDQAARLLPLVFKQEDVDLTWVRVIAGARRLGEEVERLTPPAGRSSILESEKHQRFLESRNRLSSTLARLVTTCENLEARWVNSQRVLHVTRLREKAVRLRASVERATLENWRDIQVPFL